MAASIAYLGPPGSYTEDAAIAYAAWLNESTGEEISLHPAASISQALKESQNGRAQFSVVPVENSVEGSVSMTLDTLWQLESLQVQRALVLPISHALISCASSLDALQRVYAHPQGLAQCQTWLERVMPQAQLIPTSSNTESLQHLQAEVMSGAIASQRAAELYHLPVLAHPINDYPDNCTRFWILSRQPSPGGRYTSLGFSVPANVPGALVKPLQVFAERGINLSRIESRPTKRSLGDYLFFVDIEADASKSAVQAALNELKKYVETLKVLGSYSIMPIGERPHSPPGST